MTQGFGIHADGIEGAGGHAVAEPETSERTSRLADIERSGYGAGFRTVVLIGAGAFLARAAATDRSDFGLFFGGRLSEVGRDGLHAVAAADGAEEIGDVIVLDQGIGHAATTGETAATAVRSGQHFLHLVDPGVLLDAELLRHEVEDHGREHTQHAQCQDRVK